MVINFDRAFGIHEQSVALRAYRSGVLASNVANADTPHYQARDMDFESALAAMTGEEESPRLRVTHAGHMSPGIGTVAGAELMYRVPLQPAVDGNTVDSDVEQAAFVENAMRYQASLQFLSGRIRGLMTAIRGE